MVYVVGIAAAVALALGYVLQQRAAARAPMNEMLRFQLLWDLMHRRMWWGGIASMVVGQVLGGLALQLATVAVVEPLLSTSLLFAFAIAARIRHGRPGRHEVGGALLVSASLGVFLGVGDPHSTAEPSPSWTTVVTALVVVVAVVAVLVLVGLRRRLPVEAVLLATAAGLLYGLQDMLTRQSLVENTRHGVVGMFLTPWPYLVLGSAVIGILLSQSAFRAARLDLSLPPIAVAEPVAGIALGVLLLGDRVSVSVGGLAASAACLAAMIIGVVLIGRSSALAECAPEHVRTAAAEAKLRRDTERAGAG